MALQNIQFPGWLQSTLKDVVGGAEESPETKTAVAGQDEDEELQKAIKEILRKYPNMPYEEAKSMAIRQRKSAGPVAVESLTPSTFMPFSASDARMKEISWLGDVMKGL